MDECCADSMLGNEQYRFAGAAAQVLQAFARSTAHSRNCKRYSFRTLSLRYTVHMAEHKTLRERVLERFFAVPSVAQLWARRLAKQQLLLPDSAIPFAPFTVPLHAASAALITTGGIHLSSQTPFDMENPDGDPTYREIPGDAAPQSIAITHKYYDHRDADADLNVIFPLTHFRELVGRGVLGALAPRHFGFMGHIDAQQVDVLRRRSAPEVAAKLRADGVDFAFLTPA